MAAAMVASVGAPAAALASNLCQTDLLHAFTFSRRCVRVSRLYGCSAETAHAIVLRQVAGVVFADALLEARQVPSSFTFRPASAVVDLADALARLNRQYLLTGSLASSIWDRPRLVKDIDVIVDVRGGLDELVDSLSESFLVLAGPSDSSFAHSMYAQAVHRSSGFRIELFFRVSGHGLYSRATNFVYGDSAMPVRLMPLEELLVSRLIFLGAECPSQAAKLTGAMQLWRRCGSRMDQVRVARLAKRFGVEQWLGRVKGEE